MQTGSVNRGEDVEEMPNWMSERHEDVDTYFCDRHIQEKTRNGYFVIPEELDESDEEYHGIGIG